ncbi:MAG: diversity-generating retroelement protein Avd, partial [Myxococcota bacterium]|nr:diversity-generating retroelement protein Avd [Myxococcota bacterium]
ARGMRTSGKSEGPAIFAEAYRLLLELYPAVRRFPRGQQPVLGRRIEDAALALLTGILEANAQAAKAPRLRSLSVEVEKLRVLLRLSKDLSFLSFGQYQVFVERTDAIGRMLGGWIKWAEGAGVPPGERPSAFGPDSSGRGSRRADTRKPEDGP